MSNSPAGLIRRACGTQESGLHGAAGGGGGIGGPGGGGGGGGGAGGAGGGVGNFAGEIELPIIAVNQIRTTVSVPDKEPSCLVVSVGPTSSGSSRCNPLQDPLGQPVLHQPQAIQE